MLGMWNDVSTTHQLFCITIASFQPLPAQWPSCHGWHSGSCCGGATIWAGHRCVSVFIKRRLESHTASGVQDSLARCRGEHADQRATRMPPCCHKCLARTVITTTGVIVPFVCGRLRVHVLVVPFIALIADHVAAYRPCFHGGSAPARTMILVLCAFAGMGPCVL
jgi:hypothetical protein